MDISSRAEFAADPDTVFAMLTDEAYLTEVCRASEASDYSVEVDDLTTRTRRTLSSPPSAAKFTGPTLDVIETVVWHPAHSDGSRTGDIQISVANQPVTMRGDLAVAPGGIGTVVDLAGDLKVNIPLLGKKLEEGAAPAILQGFKLHQSVGGRWLEQH